MKPYWKLNGSALYQGHVLDVLAAMEAQSVHCVVTSPPYWGLRDYQLPPVEWPPVRYAPMSGLAEIEVPGCREGCEHVWGEEMLQREQSGRHRLEWTTGGNPAEKVPDGPVSQGAYCQLCGGWRGCLGLEPTIEMYVGHMVLVWRALWRVLRDDGVCFLNLGDSYAANRGNTNDKPGYDNKAAGDQGANLAIGHKRVAYGLKPKDLCGIPWRVALALQADGWYLRSDIIWAKGVSFCPTYSGSCMPESVTDRPTKGHEYVFLLSKSARYYYDADAVREQLMGDGRKRGGYPNPADPRHNQSVAGTEDNPAGRNLRSVWTINPGSYAGAHFATFPPALVEPMIKAGTSAKGCCPECGKAWERVTELTPEYRALLESGKAWRDQSGKPDEYTNRHPKSHPSNVPQKNITTGWTPTCTCYDWDHCAVCGTEIDEHADRLDCGHNICSECLVAGEALDHKCDLAPAPCTVLDPFTGSGTVPDVARQLGRRWVGIELNEDYCKKHIIPRLSEPLMEWAEQAQQEAAPMAVQQEMEW